MLALHVRVNKPAPCRRIAASAGAARPVGRGLVAWPQRACDRAAPTRVRCTTSAAQFAQRPPLVVVQPHGVGKATHYMRDSGPHGREPTVLIASHQEASSRSLESILVPGGYLVVKAYTAAQTRDRARSTPPDVIILDTILPDQDGFGLCRELRSDPLLAFTPIIIVSPDHVTRQQRIDALRAGAWDHLGAPLDAEHLLLKVETFARTKVAVDRAREEGLLDPGT